ncbi:MAG TPA: translation elongation factor Ts [Acidimicrobiales bacterium]|nr:translation elongation factor Ts [Acidimicrobiales bacterium]
MAFTAKDVQSLRQSTGAGMMDAKKALEETDGDFDAAVKVLRERGLAKSADRSDRENAQGAVAVASGDGVAAIAELKSETDFVAKSDQFLAVLDKLAAAVLADGEAGAAAVASEVDDLKVTLKENIEVGRLHRLEVGPGQAVDTYLHKQEGRGVNAVVVVLEGGDDELAHEIAVSAAFSKPRYLSRDEVPESDVAEEREFLEGKTRAEGKPEQAIEKIVTGRLDAWYKERVLLEQPYAKDDKQTISQLLGDAKIAGFAQVYIGS